MAALKVHGTVHVPGDKSISHRALLLAALAEGDSSIRGILVSSDVAATASVLREMGVELAPLSVQVHVRGRGLRGLAPPGAPLECGNSGTTARLVAGIVAGHPFSATLVGDASLSRRPMQRVARPLQEMGALIEFANADGLPMTVHGGPLRAVDWVLETPTAQVKSAILLAALVAGVSATVRGGGRSRDHTERMLTALGANLITEAALVTIHPTEDLMPLDMDVPGDPSSAAYFAGLAAIADEGEIDLPGVGLNPTRTAFFELLRAMGADVSTTVRNEAAGEPIGTIRVRRGDLRGVAIPPEDVTELLDELPLIACLGAVAAGETRVTGAGELRFKESDRIAVTVSNLRALGADAEELPDGFVVRGSDRPLAGRVKTGGDHRIAMAFGVLSRRWGSAVSVDDRSCVAVSYPEFWDDLHRVSA
ncbi:MAG TPA: 3-phosphoshikimate 1-carboxyvinyltransferase [Gemmatimonadaceae bacterium]